MECEVAAPKPLDELLTEVNDEETAPGFGPELGVSGYGYGAPMAGRCMVACAVATAAGEPMPAAVAAGQVENADSTAKSGEAPSPAPGVT